MSFVLAQFLFESTQILIWITTRWVIAFKLLFSWIPEVGRGSILSHLSVFSNKIIYFHIQSFTCRFLLELTDTCCHHRAWGPCGADTRSNPGWGLGARGPQDKTWGREEERSPCRFELHIGSSWSTDQAGWQMFTASPNECRECGWEVPVYGLCGSLFSGPTTFAVSLGFKFCPNCFRLTQPHMRLGRVEWEALSTTHSVGEQRGQKGGVALESKLSETFSLRIQSSRNSRRKNLVK